MEQILPQVDPLPLPAVPEGMEQTLGEAIQEEQGLFLLSPEEVLPVTGPWHKARWTASMSA